MYQYKKIVILLIGIVFLGSISCDEILDVESDRVVFEDEYRLDSPNDTLYSFAAILSQMQKLADRYVLLGELRGDLMKITKNSGNDLREIYNHDISTENPYANIKDYYAVINNCNYVIHNLDTAFIDQGQKAMLPEYVSAKAIRAWVYMQMALNYGSVHYFDEPILTVEDAFASYPEYDITGLAPVLINDLAPWRDQSVARFNIAEYNVAFSVFPVRFILGDLYLWLGQYENAANEYRQLMFEDRLTVSELFQSTLEVDNDGVRFIEHNWLEIFDPTSNPIELNQREVISYIATSTEYGEGSELDSLSFYFNLYKITPTEKAMENWEDRVYIFNASDIAFGSDLRGPMASYFPSDFFPEGIDFGDNNRETDINMINKHYQLQFDDDIKRVIVYRAGLLYLRYAEAINRLGKPNMAFATLKYGLNGITLANRVPDHEKSDSLPQYMNFSDGRFSQNIGTMARGLGEVQDDTTYYLIPETPTLQDSILAVEDLIVEELARELAFEGNRYHDLMRIARHRNDPGYLANMVASGHEEDAEDIRAKLMNEENWYLPK